ncbi:MAG TPA: protease complex subunit PrcB family protein [Candidatus Limnocylindria bacterium]|jgi:hypothetical protein|nr:protease complex subunit PrcB family protein [Candidatus Limnocylindria bacterium]
MSAAVSGPASNGSVLVVRLPDAMPAERAEAAIEAAFDPGSAAALATDLPGDLDWASSGVICVFLGRREDGGWSLAIQGASLVDGELQVRARETRPAPGVDRPGPSFAADCATIDRPALPVGTLPARADDTVTDEFIVAGDLEVPAP